MNKLQSESQDSRRRQKADRWLDIYCSEDLKGKGIVGLLPAANNE
jgi:hypothetical protein